MSALPLCNKYLLLITYYSLQIVGETIQDLFMMIAFCCLCMMSLVQKDQGQNLIIQPSENHCVVSARYLLPEVY